MAHIEKTKENESLIKQIQDIPPSFEMMFDPKQLTEHVPLGTDLATWIKRKTFDYSNRSGYAGNKYSGGKHRCGIERTTRIAMKCA